jgi:phasin family protein
MTAEQLQAAQKMELESLVDLGDKAMTGIEKLIELDLQTLREATRDAAESVRSALSSQDLQELMRKEAEGPMQASTQKSMAYFQRRAEIVGSFMAEWMNALNQSASRTQQAMRDSMP